nr:hypothetical protein [Pseudomonas syringae pv. actinidiae]
MIIRIATLFIPGSNNRQTTVMSLMINIFYLRSLTRQTNVLAIAKKSSFYFLPIHMNG